MDESRGLCALRALKVCLPPTTSYVCVSSAFGTRTAPGINPYCMECFSRGPVANAPKGQIGSANFGSKGLLFGNAIQGSQI